MFIQQLLKVFTIKKGGKALTVVRLTNGNTGDPYDLTGIQEITICFKNADGTTETTLTFTSSGGITIVSAVLGKIQLLLTAAQTALLQAVDLATMQITLTFSADSANPVICQIPEAYTVVENGC